MKRALFLSTVLWFGAGKFPAGQLVNFLVENQETNKETNLKNQGHSFEDLSVLLIL